MIDVRFLKRKHKLISCEISGHANYDDYGRDIVCSAVSAICYTIANGITEVLKVKAACRINDGFLNLSLGDLKMEEIEKSQVLMETMLMGFQSMKVNYGEYINVTIEEV